MIMAVSEWFPVNVGLSQGCVMSPRLFNVNTEVNANCMQCNAYIEVNAMYAMQCIYGGECKGAWERA